MKIASTLIVVVLIFLAVFSGIAKIALFQEDVEFFSRYGFSNPMLMAFGATQVLGGILLPFRKTRFFGAAVVAVTFLVSFVLLLMDGKVSMSIVAAVATLLLALIMKRSWRPLPTDS
jgi:predicted MFS family arabinose efflux permease